MRASINLLVLADFARCSSDAPATLMLLLAILLQRVHRRHGTCDANANKRESASAGVAEEPGALPFPIAEDLLNRGDVYVGGVGLPATGKP